MAGLTVLDEKLAEVLGLAQAAQTATKKVATLARKEGEMAHWEILTTLNAKAEDPDIAEALRFAMPIQQAHVNAVREHSLRLAADEDPSQPA